MPLISNTFVPNEVPDDSSIVFVGEAPGSDEELHREDGVLRPRPFVGESGNLFTTCLGRNGILRQEIGIANLSNFRPQGNKFELLLGTPQLEESLRDLYKRLREVKPTVICAMGAWPLWFFTSKQGKKPGTGITNWRGSILPCTVEGLENVKVIPTFHPAYVYRDRSKYPIYDCDIKRAVEDSKFQGLRYPERKFVLAPKNDQLEHWTNVLLASKKIAVDIETVGKTQLSCIGFAPSSDLGIVFEWDNQFHTRDCTERILASGIPLIFHFGTYDTEVLEVFYQLKVANYWWDTMVAQHVMWPELPRSLAYQTSVLSRQPYYKHERREKGAEEDRKAWPSKTPKERLWGYNAKDICETFLAQEHQEKEMSEGPKNWKKFFDFEMREVRGPARAIMRTGGLVDKERKELLEKAVTFKWADFQNDLNSLIGTEINVNSHKQISTLLYEILELPKKYNRGYGDEKRVTADEDAIVSLIAFTKNKMQQSKRAATIAEWKRKFLVLKGILIIRGLRKLISSYLSINVSDDSRMRSVVKVGGGPKTGRWAMQKYVDGSGCNAQTMPRDPFEIPDEVVEMIKRGEV
jgi:uracil-DNA glycosylase family 4